MNSTEYYREYRAKKEGKPFYELDDMHQCLLCKKWFVFLGSHVRQTHKMFMLDYKLQFGLDTKKGRTKGKFKELKKETNRNENNLKLGEVYRFKKGAKVGTYRRSKETKERLREQGLKIGKKFGGINKRG